MSGGVEPSSATTALGRPGGTGPRILQYCAYSSMAMVATFKPESSLDLPTRGRRQANYDLFQRSGPIQAWRWCDLFVLD
jgi:hypothetical protein